jgi:uncharacterized protein (DUF1697 family)
MSRVVISILRAVNVGGHNKVKMEALRELYEELECRDSQTYVQSGNVIFRTKDKSLTQLAARIEEGIERRFGFRSDVILRTIPELRDVIARNPFAARTGIEPGKLVVNFLAADPGEDARRQVAGLKVAPEELIIDGREMFIYFPNGQGRTKLPVAAIQRILKTPGTARNWNSVSKMLEIAESMEGGR